jgi:hypothetical protein
LQRERLGDNLVLIGSTHYDYVESLRTFIKNKGFVWSSWNFRIREPWRETILDRIKTQGKFPIYFYMSKKKGGSGLVEYVGFVSEIRMGDIPTKTPDLEFTNLGEEDFPTEDFKSYTWFKFSTVDPVGPFELQIFRDIETEDPVIPSQLKSAFAYAFITERYEETILEEQPIIPTSISVERDLRKYLVAKLDFLEQGLKLYQDQERTGEEYPIEGGRMRIDILAKDSRGNFVVVELKAGVADVSTFGQVSAYIGWVKENLAKNSNVRGIIVANDFDDKMKYAVKSTPYIKLKRYKLMFEFEDITP